MIKIYINGKMVDVDHKCKDERQIAEELISALDLICTDIHTNDSTLSNKEIYEKSLASRNNILQLMLKKKYTLSFCDDELVI